MRVPTPNVSVVDLTVFVDKPATKESVNAALKAAANGPMRAFSLHRGRTRLCRLQGQLEFVYRRFRVHQSCRRPLRKVLAWYDNEWGYSCRCRDSIKLLASKF